MKVVRIGKLRLTEWMIALRLSSWSFTDRAVNVVLAARKLAAKQCHREVTPEHVLLALATDRRGVAQMALERLGVDLPRHVEAITSLFDAAPAGWSSDRPPLGQETEQLLRRTRDQARESGSRYVGTEHFILGLLSGCGPAADFLYGHGITPERFGGMVRALYTGL
jgi:ATP-dependent Clp protease ATP-binding subunit ClpB